MIALAGDCRYTIRATCDSRHRDLCKDEIERVLNSFTVNHEVCAAQVREALQRHDPPWEADSKARLFYEEAEKLLRSDQRTEAEEKYRRAMELAPEKPQARLRLGTLYAFQSKWHQVISNGRAAMQLDKGSAYARYLIGMGYHGRQQVKPAESEYLTAIALDPTFSEAYYSLAKLYGENGALDKCADYARKSISINPRSHEAHYLLAVALARSAPNEAMQHLETVLSLTAGRRDLSAKRRETEELLQSLRGK
jgi:tetratricopeptide (TPR) repeat protein